MIHNQVIITLNIILLKIVILMYLVVIVVVFVLVWSRLFVSINVLVA